ncbi:uncharacterized protein LOC127291517 [Leptopilina boulardi]|uniref:uncharacterized protein LOC127291517 n=1 Tax=Leptopilina boulardi TaxID=63433 RepID=UPI0021F57C06|nr:uncharacterized protein LOC127291517 [Leptopilina boulardi]
MTLALIGNYSKTKAKSNLTGDRFWMKISEIMHKQGYKVDGRICESKFDGLQRTYKGIIDKKKQTGTSPQKKWQFFDEMDLLLFKKPEIQPPADASSFQGYKRKIAREIDETKSTESKPKKRPVTKERQMTATLKILADRRLAGETNLKIREIRGESTIVKSRVKTAD